MDGSLLDYLPALLQGLKITLILTATSMLFGAIIGFILAMMRLLNPLSDCLRDPLQQHRARVAAADPDPVRLFRAAAADRHEDARDRRRRRRAGDLIGGYMAKVIRSGVISVDSGQMEAGRSIGFGYWRTMRDRSAASLLDHDSKHRQPVQHHAQGYVVAVGHWRVGVTMAGQTIYSFNFDTIRVLGLVGLLYFSVFFVASASRR